MSPAGSPVPQGTRLLHIGPHKTGSTAIQVAFKVGSGTARRARRRLRDAGRLPGTRGGVGPRSARPPVGRPRRRRSGSGRGSRPRSRPPTPPGCCVSNEDFAPGHEGPGDPEVVDDLGGERPVHVVSVARRLDRYLPSQWQERVKAGDERTYDEWLRVVLDTDERRAATGTGATCGAPTTSELLVERWLKRTSTRPITVVMHRRGRPALLPRTFERMLGLPDGYDPYPTPAGPTAGLSWARDRAAPQHQPAFWRTAGWPQAASPSPHPDRRAPRDLQTRPTPAGPSAPPLPGLGGRPDPRAERPADRGPLLPG